MKFKLRRPFSIQVDATKVKTYSPGEYEVPIAMPREHAEKAKKQHKGHFILEKRSPENKVVKVSEHKAKVAKKRRRSTRPKPDE